MLTVFKGDDTGGTLGKRVAITVVSELPIADSTILFSFCGVVREFTNVHSGDEIEIFFSHNDTRVMPVGIGMATLRARDASGKIRTLTNSLPIKVTTNIAECYGSDAASTTVTIRAVVTWEDVSGKPFDGKTVSLSTDDDVIAAVGTIIEKLGGQIA